MLGEIDDLRRQLRHQVRPQHRWADGLRKFLTADAVAASNSIEGFRVSTVDVVDLMGGERDVDVSDEDREETLAYQRMMSFVQSQHDVPDFAYDKGLFNGMHWMLQGHRHSRRKPAGQWRRGPVYVTDARDSHVAAYTGPDHELVPGLMHELVEWLNEPNPADHALVRAAIAHLNLVSIHPWADGNGRMSRSLQTLMIAREGVLAPEFSSIEAWLGRPGNTWEYYRQLGALGSIYSPEHDASAWLRFNLTAYHQQAQMVRFRVDRAARLWTSLVDFAKERALDERTVSAMFEAVSNGRVRRASYEQAEGLSLQQAQRDLRDLVAARILRSVGRTRARYYEPGELFPERAQEIADRPVALMDPYASE
nr:Fic family protein [Actinospica durhamensis]